MVYGLVMAVLLDAFSKELNEYKGDKNDDLIQLEKVGINEDVPIYMQTFESD